MLSLLKKRVLFSLNRGSEALKKILFLLTSKTFGKRLQEKESSSTTHQINLSDKTKSYQVRKKCRLNNECLFIILSCLSDTLSLKIKGMWFYHIYTACQTEFMFQVPISKKALPNTTLDRNWIWLPGILMSNSTGKMKVEFPQKYLTSSALGHLCDSDMSHISLSHHWHQIPLCRNHDTI